MKKILMHLRCDGIASLILAGILYAGCLLPVEAQNPTCPTRPAGDNTNACASTAFVQGAVTAAMAITQYNVAVGTGTGLTGVAPSTIGGTLGSTGAASNPAFTRPQRINASLQSGIDCTGVSDSYTAFSTLAATAKAGGYDIEVPGNCKIQINMSGSRASINLDFVHVYGAGPQSYTVPISGQDRGSWFLIKGTSNSPFTLNYSAGITGMSWVWPDQTNPASPTAYPYAISSDAGGSPINVTIRENMFINAYNAINLNTGGFNWIEDNRFSVLNIAINSTSSNAETWIRGNSFTYGWGDYFYDALGVQSAWRTRVIEHAIGIQLLGSVSHDAWNISHNTFFAYQYGILATKTPGSGATFLWAVINGNHFDLVRRGIEFDGVFRPAHLNVSGNVFNYQGTQDSGHHIAVALTGTDPAEKLDYDITITGNSLSVTTGSQILVTSPSGQAGRIVVTGNELSVPGYLQPPGTYYQVYIDAPAADVVVSGNVFDGLSTTQSAAMIVGNASNVGITGNVLRNEAVGFAIGTITGNLTLTGNTAASTVITPTSISGPISGATLNILNSWNPTVTVGYGGTGLTSGTSGGIPYFSSTSAMASSAVMTSNAVIKGGGAGAAPVASGVSLDSSNNMIVPGTLSTGNTITAIAPNSTAIAAVFRGRASDNIADFAFQNNAASVQYGSIRSSSAGGGTLGFLANTSVQVLTINNGLQVGSPTGGDKGVGTANFAADIYKNNTAYTNPDYVLEHYYTGKIERFINNEGAREYAGLMPLDKLREYTKANLRLPGITDKPMGMFERGDVALAKIEEAHLYILQLEERLAKLEAKVAANDNTFFGIIKRAIGVK